MPPHCDTLDGPVVAAAKLALEAANVSVVLPWVPSESEDEVAQAFERTLRVRILCAMPGASRTGGSSKPWCGFIGSARARPTRG